MTKYISEIKEITDAGTTGIRITIAEATTGDLEVRAVNTTDFDTIKADIKKLQDEEITTTKLEEYLKSYAKTSDLTGYAKTSDLTAYATKTDLDTMFVARITSTSEKGAETPTWNYNTIDGAHSTHCHITPSTEHDQGLVFVIRPNGYTDAQATVVTTQGMPYELIGYFKNSSGEMEPQYALADHKAYEETITWKDAEGSATHTEKCLVCPVRIQWANTGEHGHITFNFNGKSITKLWQVN